MFVHTKIQFSNKSWTFFTHFSSLPQWAIHVAFHIHIHSIFGYMSKFSESMVFFGVFDSKYEFCQNKQNIQEKAKKQTVYLHIYIKQFKWLQVIAKQRMRMTKSSNRVCTCECDFYWNSKWFKRWCIWLAVSIALSTYYNRILNNNIAVTFSHKEFGVVCSLWRRKYLSVAWTGPCAHREKYMHIVCFTAWTSAANERARALLCECESACKLTLNFFVLLCFTHKYSYFIRWFVVRDECTCFMLFQFAFAVFCIRFEELSLSIHTHTHAHMSAC